MTEGAVIEKAAVAEVEERGEIKSIEHSVRSIKTKDTGLSSEYQVL
jgi:hypothetical protein